MIDKNMVKNVVMSKKKILIDVFDHIIRNTGDNPKSIKSFAQIGLFIFPYFQNFIVRQICFFVWFQIFIVRSVIIVGQPGGLRFVHLRV